MLSSSSYLDVVCTSKSIIYIGFAIGPAVAIRQFHPIYYMSETFAHSASFLAEG